MHGPVAFAAGDAIGAWWAPFLAFLAGLISFASPCVFPLVPAYVSFVTAGKAVDAEERTVVPTLLFVAGFTLVFVVLGATAGAWVSALRGVVVQRVSGTIVVLLGLFMLAYAFRWGRAALFQERRPFLERARPGTFGALPLGMAFATGWTPCIGPVLGAILTLAATGSAVRGAFLLICYSAGLGVPFLLVGLGIDWFMGTFDWVKRNYRWIAGASGAILVVLGVLVFTGELSRVLNQWSGGFTPGL